ncbi:MAG: chemotaxis protein CheW [Treponema sp.]|nr:chemotaxis protein CheW [Treponema sp.]
MQKSVLTFFLDQNLCAVDITHVLEVVNLGTPTPIPCADPYIEGLIYSRNQGLTVINLRKKFGLAEQTIDKNTKIIVIEVTKSTEENPDQVSLYGLVADEVMDVVLIDDESLADNVKTSIPQQNIESIIRHDGKTIIMLNFKDF